MNPSPPEVAPDRLAARARKDLGDLAHRDVPTVRSVRRRYSKLLKGQPAHAVIEFALALSADGCWEERLIAYEVVAAHRPAAVSLNQRHVARMAKGLADWGTVDLFGVTILGPAWRDGRVSDTTIDRLARSSDRWRRRLALVATVPLNSKARGAAEGGDARRTLRICRQLLADRDDMVVKALSWALRELGKRDPTAVKVFVAAHDGRVAARVCREVGNKLRTGLKTPRRQSGVVLIFSA
jgi:3-methyladenine DNA glycosylase AlkD